MTLNIDEYIKVAKNKSYVKLGDRTFIHKNTMEVMTEEELIKYLRVDFVHWINNNNKGEYLSEYR